MRPAEPEKLADPYEPWREYSRKTFPETLEAGVGEFEAPPSEVPGKAESPQEMVMTNDGFEVELQKDVFTNGLRGGTREEPKTLEHQKNVREQLQQSNEKKMVSSPVKDSDPEALATSVDDEWEDDERDELQKDENPERMDAQGDLNEHKVEFSKQPPDVRGRRPKQKREASRYNEEGETSETFQDQKNVRETAPVQQSNEKKMVSSPVKDSDPQAFATSVDDEWEDERDELQRAENPERMDAQGDLNEHKVEFSQQPPDVRGRRPKQKPEASRYNEDGETSETFQEQKNVRETAPVQQSNEKKMVSSPVKDSDPQAFATSVDDEWEDERDELQRDENPERMDAQGDLNEHKVEFSWQPPHVHGRRPKQKPEASRYTEQFPDQKNVRETAQVQQSNEKKMVSSPVKDSDPQAFATSVDDEWEDERDELQRDENPERMDAQGDLNEHKVEFSKQPPDVHGRRAHQKPISFQEDEWQEVPEGREREWRGAREIRGAPDFHHRRSASRGARREENSEDEEAWDPPESREDAEAWDAPAPQEPHLSYLRWKDYAEKAPGSTVALHRLQLHQRRHKAERKEHEAQARAGCFHVFSGRFLA